MALSNTNKRTQHTAAGESTFVYDFAILNDGDIEVITTDTLGVSTTHVLDTDYSVTGVGAAGGGTVVFVTPPTAGHTVTFRRAMSLTQPVDLVTQGGFSADVVEEALDRLTMFAQQLEELLDRTLRTPAGDANSYTEFPSEVDRASRYLAFDGDGKPIASGGGPGSAEVPVTSFAATLLDDSTAAAVLTTLGISAFVQTLLDDANAAAARATLGVPQLTNGNVLCPHEGLVVARASTTTVDADATALLLTDASGNQKRFTGLNVNINSAATGAAALDTGTIATGWYYVWALGKEDGTVTAVISTASAFGSVTLPADYIYGGLIGCAYYDTSAFDWFYQAGTRVMCEPVTVINDLAGAGTSYTSVSLTAVVPPNARVITGHGNVSHDSSSSSQLLLAPTNSASNYGYAVVQNPGGTTNQLVVPFKLLLQVAQTFYYKLANSSCNGQAAITGWEY